MSVLSKPPLKQGLYPITYVITGELIHFVKCLPVNR
jgi:hypothetical protein